MLVFLDDNTYSLYTINKSRKTIFVKELITIYPLQNIIFAFLITLLSGLATAIGGGIVLFAKKTNRDFLSSTMGFSAGAMIYVSFVEILPKAINYTNQSHTKLGAFFGILSFFLGILLIAVIDKFIPSVENPHEFKEKRIEDLSHQQKKLLRVGAMTALIISIHNFPEGIVTFFTSIDNIGLGISIGIAITLHNIPEGIAVSVPIFQATHSKKKAFLFSVLSGLAEPLGALIGFAFLAPFLSPALLGWIYGAVAGVMVYISIDELLPAAQTYGKHHLSIYGFMLGMFTMAISLVLI